MSSVAIDNARINERLSAFMTKLLKKEPVDLYFKAHKTIDWLMKKKMVDVYGRQIARVVNKDLAPNSKWFGDNDTFGVTIPDTTQWAVYSMKNLGGTIPIGWEEKMEAARDDVRAYDIVKQRKDNFTSTLIDTMEAALFDSAATTNQIFPLVKIIDTTSTDVGGISRATVSRWQAQVKTSVGSFSANGMSNLRDLYNDIVDEGVGEPDLHVTTKAIHALFEAELDPDVRYAETDELARGAKSLMWKLAPVIFSKNCNSGVWYSLNSQVLNLCVDKDANMMTTPFETETNGLTSVSKMVFRCALASFNPRGLGKATGITS